MWFIQLLPLGVVETAINLLLALGAVCWLLGFFTVSPVPAQYLGISVPRVLQFLGVALLLAGAYFKGGHTVEKTWQDRVAELEEQVKQVQQASTAATNTIEERVVTKINVIKERGNTVYIDRPVLVEYEKQCPLPHDVIEIHNAAVDLAISNNQTLGDNK